MTTPKINTISRGGSRLYVHPETAEKVPGVTSILNMLPKGFLKWWAAKSVAQAAVDNLGEVVGITLKAGPEAAVDFLKRSPDRDVKQAADKGTEVHDLFERMARGETIGRTPPDMKPYIEIFEGFERQFAPEFLHLEATVWSDTHGYAGSFDWLGTVVDPDTGERVLAIGDWKTTRSGVHEEVALQLAAYKNADYIVLPDGSKLELPAVDVGLVVHARPEGGKVVPANIDDAVFEVFLHLKAIFEYEREFKKTVLGKEIPILAAPTPSRARKATA